MTEPTSGTDTTRLQTFARRDGDDYVINGQKIWISRAEHSDLMVLLVRTTPREQCAKATDGMSVFLVDMREAIDNGLTVRPIRTMLNHATTELFFDDLRVPATNLIGEEGKGFRYILSGMNAERILIASECIGDARFFIDRASAYAKDRSVFGRPIGQNQGVQFPSPAPMCRRRRQRPLSIRPPQCSTPASLPAPRRTWPRCWPQRPRGSQPTCASKPTAVSASRKNTTSNGSSVRRAFTKSRRSLRT